MEPGSKVSSLSACQRHRPAAFQPRLLSRNEDKNDSDPDLSPVFSSQRALRSQLRQPLKPLSLGLTYMLSKRVLKCSCTFQTISLSVSESARGLFSALGQLSGPGLKKARIVCPCAEGHTTQGLEFEFTSRQFQARHSLDAAPQGPWVHYARRHTAGRRLPRAAGTTRTVNTEQRRLETHRWARGSYQGDVAAVEPDNNPPVREQHGSFPSHVSPHLTRFVVLLKNQRK